MNLEAQMMTKTGKHARKRWIHENNILKEKHQGYHYEHIFSNDWNAMRSYHYLMHIARTINELSLYFMAFIPYVKEFGMQWCIQKFREAMIWIPLDKEKIRPLLDKPHQLRLVWESDWKIHEKIS